MWDEWQPREWRNDWDWDADWKSSWSAWQEPNYCRCCGYSMSKDFGMHDICGVCKWEEDGAKLTEISCANRVCLVRAQQNFEEQCKSENSDLGSGSLRSAAWKFQLILLWH